MPVDPTAANSGLPVSPITSSDIQSGGTQQGLYSAVEGAKNQAASNGQQLDGSLAGFDLVKFTGMEYAGAMETINNSLRMDVLNRSQGG